VDNPDKQQTAVTVKLASLPAKQRAQTLSQALERYREGESLYEIAPSMGFSKTSLYRHLLTGELAEEWRVAKISHAMADLEDAEQQLRDAPDALGITRARERVRAAQWHLERLFRKMYGQDRQPEAHEKVSISINFGVAKAQQTPLVQSSNGDVVDVDCTETDVKP